VRDGQYHSISHVLRLRRPSSYVNPMERFWRLSSYALQRELSLAPRLETSPEHRVRLLLVQMRRLATATTGRDAPGDDAAEAQPILQRLAYTPC
jgi:hypothetical protein